MPARDLFVHLVPTFVEAARLGGGVAVVIDVLRATTTIVHALAAGCICVRPCAEIDEAQALAASLPKKTTLLGGQSDAHDERLRSVIGGTSARPG